MKGKPDKAPKPPGAPEARHRRWAHDYLDFVEFEPEEPIEGPTGDVVPWAWFVRKARLVRKAVLRDFRGHYSRIARVLESVPRLAPPTGLTEPSRPRGEPRDSAAAILRRKARELRGRPLVRSRVLPYHCGPGEDVRPPAATIDSDLQGMADSMAMALAMQEVTLARLARLVTRQLPTKGGGARGARASNPPEVTDARKQVYVALLRDFYRDNPGAKWEAAYTHVAETDPKSPSPEAVRKFLARHKVKAADFSA